MALMRQPDSALVWGTVGRGFESLRKEYWRRAAPKAVAADPRQIDIEDFTK